MSGPGTDTLYHIQYWSSSRVVQLIHELGVQDRVRVAVIDEGTLKGDPDFGAKNPQKCLPFYEDAAGFSMVESAAIMSYLLEKYDAEHRLSPAPAGPAASKADLQRRATFLQWLHYGPGTMYHVVVPVFMATFQVPVEKRDKSLIEKQIKRWNDKVVPTLVNTLKDGRQYLMGDHFSAADISVGYDLMTASFVGIESLFSEPLIKAYFERLTQRESYKALYTPPANQ